MSHAIDAAERVARESYGKLLAWLSWQWRDVCSAEDALSEAFASALHHWPQTGIPQAPEAWILTAAKRNLLMHERRARLESDPAATILFNDLLIDPATLTPIPDYRLRLLLVCAHPAIDKSIHAALMLQLVFGIDAARIASAFLVIPSALSKRLVRAKAKIRDARIAFVEPEGADLSVRIDSILEAIYGLYTINDYQTLEAERYDMADEAVYLARLLSESLPDEAEVQGLAALLLFRESRRIAQVDDQGRFVPLYEQNTTRWKSDQIRLAETTLGKAARLQRVGQFQLEAAIQAAHMQCVYDGNRRWCEIAVLYEKLLEISDTIGARIGYAIAISYCHEDSSIGLALLDSLDQNRVVSHQPWWASRAALLSLAGVNDEAKEAYLRASALTSDEKTKVWLIDQAEKLSC